MLRDRFLQKLFPERAYRREYLSYLYYQHRNFDVKGLTTQGTYTLELEQVFVDLALAPQPRQARVLGDPLRPLPSALAGERHELWTYLTDQRMKSQNLVIVGPPGSGKTTLLKHITLLLTAERPLVRRAVQLDKLPILLFLRDHASAIVHNPGYSLLQALQERLAAWGVEIPTDWLKTELKNGRCLIMLDGLDEVADAETRRRVVAWVERLIKQYNGNRFIVTSRPFGYYSNPLQRVALLAVRPFTIQQVQDFVHNWYLANEVMATQRDDPGVRMEARQGAEDLLWRLRQVPVLLEMAVNPLLLTMIATVHRYRSSLPGRRVELYAEICEVFLGKRQQARGLTFDLTPAQKQRVLQSLAYYMMQKQQREIPLAEAVDVIQAPLQRVSGVTPGGIDNSAESFLAMIENGSGLLIEREAGIYSFAHLTFQEYLAAVHACDQKLEQALVQWVADSWWHETIRLYAAQADATHVIKACLARKRPSVSALTLAMECLEEAREVRPELRKIFQRLAQSVDHSSPEVRQIAAEVFLTLRFRRLVRVDENKYVDTTLITNAEYQLFLNEARLHGRYYQPDHWSRLQYAAGQGRAPVVGVRPADAVAFCEWLSQRESGQWQYRLPRSQEINLAMAPDSSHVKQTAPATYWMAEVQCAPFDLQTVAEKAAVLCTARLEKDWDLLETPRHGRWLDQLQTQIVARAQQRLFTMLDLDRDLSAALQPWPQLQQDLARVRDRAAYDSAYNLDHALETAIAIVNNPNLEQARDVDLDTVSNLAQLLNRNLDKAHDLELPRGMTQEIMRSVHYARDLSSNREVVLYQELDRALNTALRQTRELSATIKRAYVRARFRIRTSALTALTDLLAEDERRSGQTPANRDAHHRANVLVDLYLDFVLLEERIAGKLPAFEGIRIVRERAALP